MILRRTLLGSGMALAAAAGGSDGVPPGNRLSFRVLRKGSEIGSHVLDFRRDGDALEVRIDVRMAVTFGPITLFRYRHSGTERSAAGRFVSLETQTDNDGEALRVTARRDGDGVTVEATGLARQTLPATARPLTHWNRACMAAPLFNPQDGKVMRLTVMPRGDDTVALASGASVTAAHYALTGEATLDDWYGADDVWTALRALGKDGSVIDYRRVGA
jgi:hypothetical protein